MKKTMIALLCAAQFVTAAQPAFAAELHSDRSGAHAQMGSFAGARLRVPLGGGRERPQAGLAPTALQRSADTGALRFATGAELGFSKGEALSLKLGGRPVSNLVQGGRGPQDKKLGVSTVGWVAIGVGAVALLVAVLFAACSPSTNCIDDGDG